MSNIKGLTKGVAYLRTSSASNIGVGKDSDKRQMLAILEYAKRAKVEIVATFYDADVRGADPIDTRPQFVEMLKLLMSNGTRTIIVETASRFSRDLITQETGHALLKAQGISLVAADSPDAFLDDTPTAILIRQVLGAVSQFEKAVLVSKLKGARDRKSAAQGKRVEGRKSHTELNPELVTKVKKMHRYQKLSLRGIASKLAEEGILNEKGKTFGPQSIKQMMEQ